VPTEFIEEVRRLEKQSSDSIDRIFKWEDTVPIPDPAILVKYLETFKVGYLRGDERGLFPVTISKRAVIKPEIGPLTRVKLRAMIESGKYDPKALSPKE